MRAKLAIGFAALLSVMAAGRAVAFDPASPVGLWQAIDDATKQPRGWFLITYRNGTFNGIIAKMYLRPGDDPNVVCSQCKGDRHDKPWLGLEIIRGMKAEGDNKFEDGTILDPRDGKVYDAKMTLSPDGQTLTVRGYLGISLLGRNQYWSRLPDSDYSMLDPQVKALATDPAASH